MTHIAAIGERLRVVGLKAAGVLVLPAEHAEAVRAAWDRLPTDVGLVIVTAAAAEVLGPELLDGEGPLTAVMPP